KGLDHTPAIVFVTAHSDFAAQAFEIEAVDYLLKPVSPARLAQALERLRPHSGGHLATRTKNGTKLIKTGDLTIIQAQGDYVLLCSATHGDELMHITLKRLAEQLPTPPFHPVSRSTIINVEHISQASHLSGLKTEVSCNTGFAPIVLCRISSLRVRRAMARAACRR